MKTQLNKITILSLIIFITSLFLEAFYIGESQRPYFSIACLLMGLIGFIGVPAWLANPLYLLALINSSKNINRSFVYSFLALLFSLSFLLNQEILMDEGGGKDKVVAYGWGYYLWVLSIAILTINQFVKWITKENYKATSINYKILIAALITMIFIGSGIFFYQYFYSENSHYKLKKFRNDYMKTHCPLAKEVFYEEPNYVKGIYLSEYSLVRGEQFTGANNPLHPIKFWEQPYTFSGKSVLTRFYSSDSYEKDIDKLESEYSVITTELSKELDKKYDIWGTSLAIIDNKSKIKIAETISYSTQGQVCNPNQQPEYSYIGFVIKGLRLDRE